MNKPSKEDMRRVNELWEKDEKMEHHRREWDELVKLLTNYKENMNLNIDLNKIIQKISAIDKTYRLGVRRHVGHYEYMAKRIIDVNFDTRVQNWDKSLIADLCNSILFHKKPYSFMSVYCTLHNRLFYKRDDYVVNTGAIKNKLKKYQNEYPKYKFADFIESDLKKVENYEKFKQILENFIDDFQLNCNLEDLDRYFWRMSKLGE